MTAPGERPCGVIAMPPLGAIVQWQIRRSSPGRQRLRFGMIEARRFPPARAAPMGSGRRHDRGGDRASIAADPEPIDWARTSRGIPPRRRDIHIRSTRMCSVGSGKPAVAIRPASPTCCAPLWVAASVRRASRRPYRIVGMTYSAPARMPVGQRAVIVLRRV
jgi:hypothetical protein